LAFHSKSYLRTLEPKEVGAQLGDWQSWAHASQREPPGADWRIWLLLGGRGAGKTRAGAEWINNGARTGRFERMALIAPTFHDVREVMIEGASGVLACAEARPTYEASRRRLVWPNGAQAHCFSAEDPASVRGPQFDAAWGDEIAYWARPQEMLDTLAFALRLGPRPLTLLTTTPRPMRVLTDLVARKDVAAVRASTARNSENLAPGFVDALTARYGGTTYARQELLGELIADPEGAAWTRAQLDATMRGTARDAAIMGELTWALWAGPVGRWDRGNVFRVKLYGGVLESVSEEDVLNGANVFAVEGEDGAWEILQARTCELAGPNEYELSGLLRGLKDSRHAMGSPTPVGARFVKLDARLARLSMPAHEWRMPRVFIAPPAGAPATDAAAESATLTLAHVGARPFRPVHLRARRAPGGDVTLRWLRQTRAGGLYWGPGEPPLGEPAERYTVEILDGAGLVRRAVESSAPEWVYSAAAQSADFGAPPANLRFRVGQIGADSMPGLKTEATIPL